MAHKLDFQRGNDKAAFFSVKEVAWHKLGKVVEEAPNSEEAIKLAELDYEVKIAPLYATVGSLTKDDAMQEKAVLSARRGTVENAIPTEYFGVKQMPINFATYRDDTKHVFGIVGSRYEVVQNRDAFNFFDEIIGSKEAIFETAGAINDGATIFITAKLPDYIRVNGDDVINKYLLFTSSHDGTNPVRALFTPIRVVCNNTLSLALASSNGVTIRHTANVHNKIKEAANLLGIVNKQTEELNELLSQLTKVRIDETAYCKYLDFVFLTKEERQQLALGIERTDIISTNKLNIISSIKEYNEVVVNNEFEHCKGTIYGAYNSVTGYLQNVKKYQSDDKKFSSLFLDDKVGVKALNAAYNTYQSY
jgi:phage/plasmid-like protein (TIGR03299 family)